MKHWYRLVTALALSGVLIILFLFESLGTGMHLPLYATKKFVSFSRAEVSINASTTYSVVINEVAWGGTTIATDEWIELYNNAPYTVSLAGWRLHALDGSPDITLQGTVNGQGYYLIERTDDNTISDIPADIITAFGYGLSNEGEVLILSDQNNRIIDSANISDGPWPNAGDTQASMERLDPQVADTDANWASNNGQITNGLDANGTPVRGTPKSQNSVFAPVTAECDLSISKFGPALARSGEIITYTIIFSNTGTIPAETAVITDHFPNGLQLLDYSDYLATSMTAYEISWYADAITPSVPYTLMVSFMVSSTQNFLAVNHITVTSSTTETKLTNNTAAVHTQIGQPGMLISGLLVDGYQLNDTDEAIELTNPTITTMNLANWSICKSIASNLYCMTLPEVTVTPGANFWIAKDSAAFETTFGYPPDIVLETWLNLANDGGIIYLRDNEGRYVDTLVYGDSPTDQVVGWSGRSVVSYYNFMRGTTGQIIKRIPDETTGLPIPDTSTSRDWLQNPDDPLYGRRVWYPGWEIQPLFWPLKVEENATIIVGIAPDNAFDVISTTILSAQSAISIEIYTFNNPHLLPLLMQKAIEGVSIRILLEGNPVGIGELSAEWQTQLFICSEIERVGGECWFMMHDSDQRVFNRYEYLHSKMVIVDDAWVIIGSQNFSTDSLPTDDKSNGTYGTRGCIIATNAPSAVNRARTIFTRDIDFERYNDLIRWNTGTYPRYLEYQPDLVDLTVEDPVSYTTHFTRPFILNDTFDIELFTAPEAALRQSDALLGLISQAGHGDSVLVEEMYEYASWGENPVEAPNLRLEAYVNAARKGARVRILLNGMGFGTGSATVPETNIETISYIREIALNEHLDIRAALGNPSGGGIHNKMILVDLQQSHVSHISSINGSEGSSKVNREVGLQIESEVLYNYLATLFNYDWWISQPIYMPLVLKNHTTPPPPVNYLVISEVFYSANPAVEWVEIYNPTKADIDLAAFKVGDAESRNSYEPMFSFPLNATIQAHDTVVIAVNASAVHTADYEFYESDPEISNMVIDPNWGSVHYPFSLRDDGDQVLLLGQNYMTVDSIAWGDAVYPGIITHVGKVNISASLERYPPYYDTDNCAMDFRERYPPTPGEVPNQQ